MTDDYSRYTRNDDRDTSKEAAELVDLTVHERDWRSVKGWLNRSADGMGTIRELGQCLADKGYYESWETGRRRIRTMEEHGLLEWAKDGSGRPIRHKNVNGRNAECLRLCHPPASVINMPHGQGRPDPSVPPGEAGAEAVVGYDLPGDIRMEDLSVHAQRRLVRRRGSGEGRLGSPSGGTGDDEG